MREIETALNKWGLYMAKTVQRKLERGRKSATGDLINSIDYTYRYDQARSVYELRLTGKPYLINVDKGRRAFPNRKVKWLGPFHKAILNWVTIKHIRPKGAKKYNYKADQTGFAYGVARKINQHGIKPFPILDTVKNINQRKGFISDVSKAVRIETQRQIHITISGSRLF